MQKAIIITIDGIMTEYIPYNTKPERLRLFPEVGEALHCLQHAGYMVIGISRQPGVAHGYFFEEALGGIAERLRILLLDFGVRLNGFYYCPHDELGTMEKYTKVCFCKFPLPGLLLKAADDLSLNLSESWVIGDTLDVIESGKRVVVKTILIDNGTEAQWQMHTLRIPDHMVTSLSAASNIILSKSSQLPQRPFLT